MPDLRPGLALVDDEVRRPAAEDRARIAEDALGQVDRDVPRHLRFAGVGQPHAADEVADGRPTWELEERNREFGDVLRGRCWSGEGGGHESEGDHGEGRADRRARRTDAHSGVECLPGSSSISPWSLVGPNHFPGPLPRWWRFLCLASGWPLLRRTCRCRFTLPFLGATDPVVAWGDGRSATTLVLIAGARRHHGARAMALVRSGAALRAVGSSSEATVLARDVDLHGVAVFVGGSKHLSG